MANAVSFVAKCSSESGERFELDLFKDGTGYIELFKDGEPIGSLSLTVDQIQHMIQSINKH